MGMRLPSLRKLQVLRHLIRHGPAEFGYRQLQYRFTDQFRDRVAVHIGKGLIGLDNDAVFVDRDAFGGQIGKGPITLVLFLGTAGHGILYEGSPCTTDRHDPRRDGQ